MITGHYPLPKKQKGHTMSLKGLKRVDTVIGRIAHVPETNHAYDDDYDEDDPLTAKQIIGTIYGIAVAITVTLHIIARVLQHPQAIQDTLTVMLWIDLYIPGIIIGVCLLIMLLFLAIDTIREIVDAIKNHTK